MGLKERIGALTAPRVRKPSEPDELCADPADPIRRQRVLVREEYERVLAFWVATYGIDESYVYSDGVVEGGLELHAYHLHGKLIGTVAFRAGQGRKLFGRTVPDDFPPGEDVVEISKLCIAKEHREGQLMRRICEDVHARLVLSKRTHLAIAAPPWLRKQYTFIGFSGTGVRFPIPGVDGHDLEIMLSRQMRFGTYGLHTDPVRWNMFLGRVTERMEARGIVRHEPWQRRLVGVYRAFEPIARRVEKLLTFSRRKRP